MKPSQDWKIAALTHLSYVHFLFGGFMNDDIYFMTEALKEASKAYNRNEVPVGVVLVKEGKVIVRTKNEKEFKHDVTKHAEIIALQKASKKEKNWHLDDYTMYVTLYPCPMCASAIVQSRIKRLVIGAATKDMKIKKIGDLIFSGNNTSPKLDVLDGVLELECQEILSSFFRKQRNIVKNK